VAPRKIHTRAYPDLNPLEIVDNPESILRKSPKIKFSTVFRSPLRANSVPENLVALQETHGGGTIKHFTSLRAKKFHLVTPHSETPERLNDSTGRRP